MQLQKLALCAAVVTLLAMGQTDAEEAAPKEAHPRQKVDADANKDGKISRDEFFAAQEKRIDAMFRRMDTNADGFIDEAEKQASKDKMREMREHRREMHEKAATGKPQ
jgi:Ca2+-binding EF-hand superfamily protein